MSKKHDALFHAKQLVYRLVQRPVIIDDDGYYDIYADEKQMIEIIEKYLKIHYERKS